jgi:predicted alpha-1,2-mannosidase
MLGAYLGFDGAAHTLAPADPPFLTDLSLWDVHRTQLPLLALVRPPVAAAVAASLLRIAREGGELPRWPIGNVYGACMFGSGAARFLADAAANGILGAAEVGAAFEAVDSQQRMRKPCVHACRGGQAEYNAQGYVPQEVAKDGAVLTLSYAFDDWSAARLANLSGRADDAAFYTSRSQSYRNVWSAEAGFFCARNASGAFDCPPHPASLLRAAAGPHAGQYPEGDAWHYRFFVPHDGPGLVSLFAAANLSFVDELGTFAERAKQMNTTWLANPYFWVGNEHDLLSPHMFAYAGRPDLAHEHVRWTLANRFSAGAGGIPGNNDYGATSAWAVWGMLGLYPELGTGRYFLGSPTFGRVQLSVGESSTLTIVAHGVCGACVYVHNATVNGRALRLPAEAFVEHADLVRAGGATLEMWMATARPAWASQTKL